MRRIPKIKEPKHVDRTFVIKDFSKYSFGDEYVADGALKQTVGLSYLGQLPSGVELLKAYFVRGSLYGYFSDSIVRVFKSGSWRVLLVSNLTPYIIPFKKDGKECTLIKGSSAFIRYDDDVIEVVQMPYGDSAVIYKGMLFVAKDNKLTYSKLFNYQDFTEGLQKSGFVTTDMNFGKIIALIPTESSLIIICERAIYHLYAVGQRENYSLVKQDVALKAEAGSVQNAGDKTYLISDGFLCKYQGGKLSKVDCGLDFLEFNFSGQSGVDANTYYATFTGATNNNYILVYNDITGEQNLIKTKNTILSDGGYSLGSEGVKKITKASVESGVWQSVKLDFGYPNIKSLTAVAIKSNSDIAVKIDCSYASEEFEFKKGYNQIKTHFTDKSFKLTITAQAEGLDVERIKFTYRLQEV